MNIPNQLTGSHEMRPAQRILFAARHAFLKQGYLATTLKKIAQYSDTRPEIIRYHFGSKEKIFSIIFLDFIEILVAQLKRSDTSITENDFQKRKIEYPEVYEIAWFVANEFQSNQERVHRILKEKQDFVDELHKIYENTALREKFEKLIRINVSMIMQRNVLRLGS